jgi:hypothetical protein
VNYLYGLLGFVIPLPIFFDILSLKFVVVKVSNAILTGVGVAIPISIGSFAIISIFTLIGMLFSNFSQTLSKKGYISLIFIIIFSLYAIQSLTFFRVISLVIPYVAVFIVYFFIKNSKYFYSFIRGYEAGMLSFIILHFVSIMNERYFNAHSFMDIGETSSIFITSFYGYNIYQSLVSYSAVLSFFGIFLLIKIFSKLTGFKRLLYVTTFFMIYVIIGYGARKAALLDLFILSSIVLYFLLFRAFVGYKINKQKMFIMLSTLLTVVMLLLFSMYAERSLSYSSAINARGHAYDSLFSIFYNGNLLEIILGHGNGEWGGYGNFFIEMVMRLGLAGLLLYFSAMFLIFRELVIFLKNRSRLYKTHNLSIWFTFVLLSLLSSNVVNLNLQLPYYTFNIIFVSILFMYSGQKITFNTGKI